MQKLNEKIKRLQSELKKLKASKASDADISVKKHEIGYLKQVIVCLKESR